MTDKKNAPNNGAKLGGNVLTNQKNYTTNYVTISEGYSVKFTTYARPSGAIEVEATWSPKFPGKRRLKRLTATPQYMTALMALSRLVSGGGEQ